MSSLSETTDKDNWLIEMETPTVPVTQGAQVAKGRQGAQGAQPKNPNGTSSSSLGSLGRKVRSSQRGLKVLWPKDGSDTAEDDIDVE
jgi:hypothetical protein